MKYLFTLFATVIFTVSFSQTKGASKLYGYKEPVLPGTIPKNVVDENGKESSPKINLSYNYFIYIASPSKVYPIEIWLDGKVYSVKSETVSKTPVERKNYNIPSRPKTILLVPKTKNKVLMLTMAPAVEEKQILKTKTLTTSNQLVVVYKQKGKFYYSTLKNLTPLEAIATQ